MARKTKISSYVLDSWAVLAYFEDEPAGEKVADVIADTNAAGEALLMTAVNAGEVWYITARNRSEVEANKIMADLLNVGVQMVDADWSLALAAARFKSQHSMSFADCFAAALAQERGAYLVTGDAEFKQVSGVVSLHILNEEEW